jgi:hypothetical protein
MIALSLWALATLDAALTGYRDAAGRSALIDKRAYYRRAMLRGALFGQVAVGVVGVVVAVLLLLSPEPRALFGELERVGSRMIIVYVPYALIILFTFVVRAAPSVDLRSITSVLIFGPFTLIRPLVVVAGVAWGFLAAPGPATLSLCLLTLSLMLALERVMGSLRARGMIS